MKIFDIQFLYSVVMVAILFGGTVFIHELGHFLTAKWFGLRIDAFSIGMGPVLWQKTINGTSYRISLLPIGGYVALPQMDITGSAFENEDAKKGKLEPVAPWKRIIIAVAGPFMNVVAAFVLCLVVYNAGKPYDPGPGPAVVGWMNPNSVAYEAGLREGDLIREVNGDRVHFWTDFQIATSLNQRLELQVIRDREVHYVSGLETERNPLGFLYLPGVGPIEHVEHVLAQAVQKGSPAESAGLEPGDILHKINGEEVESINFFRAQVQESEGNPLSLTILRGDEMEEFQLSLAPQFDEELGRWLIGINLGETYQEVMVHPQPVEQMHYFSGVIFRTLRGLIRPRERGEAAGGIGGPAIMIGSIHQQVQLHPMQALWFTALINVNLAIINLLPLIVLDGGHIMVALFEIVTGKKIHKKLIIAMANTMVALLLTLMVLLTFKDVRFYFRLNQWRNENAAEEVNREPNDTPKVEASPEANANEDVGPE
ncbi:MAG: RIP metalloprotease RseP [Verrucomicrobia bacterium]|nr:RIP metalloprotease RseP [Verrucomicrobiota bacterium]MCH8511523.1 RIP metalloprotease RseP [Kiritimatiellia bacterium]